MLECKLVLLSESRMIQLKEGIVVVLLGKYRVGGSFCEITF